MTYVIITSEYSGGINFRRDFMCITSKYSSGINIVIQAFRMVTLRAPKSQRFLRFAIAMPIAESRNRYRFSKEEKAMLHCDLRLRWKVASDLRFRAAISEPRTDSFCGNSGDLGPSTWKSLAIAIVRFWCAKT